MIHVIVHLIDLATTPLWCMAAFGFALLKAERSANSRTAWVILAVAISLWLTFLYVGAMCGAELYDGLRAIPAHASGGSIA